MIFETIFSKNLIFIEISLLVNIIVSLLIGLKEKDLDKKDILKCSIFETIGIIVGAKLLDIVINYDVYLYYIKLGKILTMISSGYIFLGGAIGGFLAVFIYSTISKKSLYKLCNIFIPNLILIYSIAKISCFINGCCRGITINGYILPIQIIESLIYLIIYLYIIKRKNSTYSKLYLSCIRQNNFNLTFSPPDKNLIFL